MSSFVCGVGTLRELSPQEMDEALREHIAQRTGRKRYSHRLHRLLKSVIEFRCNKRPWAPALQRVHQGRYYLFENQSFSMTRSTRRHRWALARSATASTSSWECFLSAIPVAILVMQAIPSTSIPR